MSAVTSPALHDGVMCSRPSLLRSALVDGRQSATASVDVGVIGGGVIGLAIARRLALAGREVFLIEKERFVGFHTSSRNSEVIHAGIHYPLGSLKARLCVTGREALYAYCGRARRPARAARESWWWPPATRSCQRSSTSGARPRPTGSSSTGWTPDDVKALEPEVSAVRGLWSPSTGIVDSHAFMAALREDAERAGATVILGTPVLSGRDLRRRCRALPGRRRALAGQVPAGDQLCRALGPGGGAEDRGFSSGQRPPAALRQGTLLRPLRPLALPPSGLSGPGAGRPRDARHARPRRDGRASAPTCSGWNRWTTGSTSRGWTASTPPSAATGPGLPDGALQPGYTGIRPKVTGPGEPAGDFLVHGPCGARRARAWCTSTGLSPPGSPRHWRSRTRSRPSSRPEPRSGRPR